MPFYPAKTKDLFSWWVDRRPHIVQVLYLTNVQNAQGHLVPFEAAPRAAVFGDSRRGMARSSHSLRKSLFLVIRS